MSRLLRLMMVFAVFPVTVTAQGNPVVNPVYRRAQTLVNDGNAIAGRAIVDSMIAVAAQGSNEYAEGVYWRAVLAATALNAEMDYRRIVVDYPRSPRVEDALVRLAQLEIARANYDGAIRHLNTLVADHPQSPSRGRAGYWMARALFDKNDVQGGCTATADALTRTSEDDTELRNQINYLNQRCAGLVLTAPASGPVAAAIVLPADSTRSMPTPIPAKVITPPEPPSIQAQPIRQSVQQPVTRASTAVKKPEMVKLDPAIKPVLKSAPDNPVAMRSGGYSVQIAAYNVKSQATAMAAKLKQRGYEARVDGDKAPFRVRIGRYTTAAQASAVQRSLKAKQIDGFVVQPDTQ